MRIGSLFSGAGGLDMAVQEVFGGSHAWFSEIDPAASKVLAYRFPFVQNLGDITTIDWAAVEPVDVLCGGFPCQDVSAAGKRAGIKHGTRSGLWAVFAEAIDALRPRWVVIENVRGLLSATAERAVEPDEATVGDGAGRPVLRAAGAVLGDLADLGYDAQWTTVAASSVGAPHRRERVFVLASHADADEGRWGGRRQATWGDLGRHNEVNGRRRSIQTEGRGGIATDTPRYGWDEGRPESAGIVGGFDAAVSADEPGVALLPTPRATDPAGAHSRSSAGFRPQLGEVVRQLRSECRDEGGEVVDDDGAVPVLTPNASDGSGGGQHPDKREGHSRQLIDYVLAPSQWGKYAPAIARWEQATGQPAPPPTEPNKNGNPRLSAAFSEWLMGWPPGWVTDPAIGISRNDQLRCVGNGVCPQQAAHALTYLTAVAANTHTHTPAVVPDVTAMLPTPCARDYKDGEFPASHARKTPSLGAISHYLKGQE